MSSVGCLAETTCGKGGTGGRAVRTKGEGAIMVMSNILKRQPVMRGAEAAGQIGYEKLLAGCGTAGLAKTSAYCRASRGAEPAGCRASTG